MHPLVAILLAFAPVFFAQEAEGSTASAAEVDSPPEGTIRVTAGLGGGAFGLVGVARGLFGAPASNWRFGGQATLMTELKLFTTPTENVGSVHWLVGRELSPARPFSAVLFAGVGMAGSRRRGKLLEDKSFSHTYESIHSTDPSLLAGMDVGFSYPRHIGVSLQLGAQVSRVTSTYMALQLDVGA